MDSTKAKFLRDGLEAVLKDIIESMPDSPTFIAVGIGVVYIPVGKRGISQVVSGYRIDDNFAHHTDDALRDLGEVFLAHSGMTLLSTKPSNN